MSTVAPGPPRARVWRIVAVTYELTPEATWIAVVRHEFYGDTPERAWAVYQAHLKSDRFLHDCERGQFDGVTCRTQVYPPEWIG